MQNSMKKNVPFQFEQKTNKQTNKQTRETFDQLKVTEDDLITSKSSQTCKYLFAVMHLR